MRVSWCAAEYRHEVVVKLLLQEGAMVYCINSDLYVWYPIA